MILYIIIWLVLFVLSFWNVKRNFLLNICTIILILLAGFRGETIGTDTHTYLEIYHYVKEGGLPVVEPGYYFLMYLLALLKCSDVILLTVVATLTLGCVLYVIKRDSPNAYQSLFIYYSLYFYCFSFNGMRQVLAISFALLGFHYLYHDRIKYFFVYILIATSFHYSTILGLIVFFIKKIPSNKLVIILSLLFTFSLGYKFTSDSTLVHLLGPYSEYIVSGKYAMRDNSVIDIVLVLILNILFLFIYSVSGKIIRINFWFKLFWIAILLNNILFRLVLGTRMIMLFTVAQIILYPFMFEYIQKKGNKKILQSIIVLYLCVYFFKILILGNTGEYSIFPYYMSI